MPNLGDFLGHMMSEITIARMHADLESLRIAELYANHELLRNMPVPRFRLPDVSLDVPVVINEMDDTTPGKPTRGGVDFETIRKSFDKSLALVIKNKRIRLKPEQRKNLNQVIDKAIESIEQPLEVDVDTNRIADLLSRVATKSLTEILAPRDKAGTKRIKDFSKELKAGVRIALIKTRTPPPRLSVLVTTSEIREAGPDEVITHLRLKISEESMEWTTIDTDGEMKERLIPE